MPQPNQPSQPTDTDQNRRTRRLRYPVPLPGQPIYPGNGTDPTPPTTTPGQTPGPYGLPPTDPNQTGTSPDNNGQQL